MVSIRTVCTAQLPQFSATGLQSQEGLQTSLDTLETAES